MNPIPQYNAALRDRFLRHHGPTGGKLFGPNRIDLFITSTATGTTRHYQKAAQLKQDTKDARIWLGLHFRKAMDDGNRVGRASANYVLRHEFQPRS